jgi:hypothetical protein
MNRDKTLSEHVFVFNEDDNGGESLSLTTKFIANGDPITDKDGVYLNQELSLQSYCNASTFHLYGALLTPEDLRKLANELEQERNKLVKS